MSDLEDTLVKQIRLVGLDAPEREFYFAKPRRWRFDLCWPERMLAAEVQGGSFSRGRHTRGIGMRKDAEKMNAAAIAGWRVLLFTTDMIKDGSAVQTLERAMRTPTWGGKNSWR